MYVMKKIKKSKEKKVAIVISTFNQGELLEQCLESLKKKTIYNRYRVFIVDDGGKEKIGQKIKDEPKFSWTKVLINKKNEGFSKANNLGIKVAIRKYSPDYVLLLNDDTEIVQKDWLNRMIEAGESDAKIGILGCKIIYPNGEIQNLGGHIKGMEITRILKYREKIIDVDHVMGAFMLIKRKVIEKIGLLDEVFTPYLLEDTDYCLRAKKSGFLIKTVSYVKIIHKKGKTIDSLKDKRKLFIRFKNDIIFSRRHLKFKYRVYRIWVYLPMVAMLKKRKDEDELKIKNLRVRADFLLNLLFLLAAHFKVLFTRY